MKHQPKDTDTFVYHNQNPKNKSTGDCVIRALSTATGIPYNDVLLGLVTIQIKTGYMVNCRECYGKWLKELGWVQHKQPKKDDGRKYTGREFCQALWHQELDIEGDHRIIAHIGTHHVVAIMNWQVWDIWNSSGGCIGVYWTKP